VWLRRRRRTAPSRRAQVARERAQVVHRAERRLDRAVVGDRVAAVVGLRPRVQQRHQVQVGDAELAQVRQRSRTPASVPAKRSA
jgi:hypothetical protein